MQSHWLGKGRVSGGCRNGRYTRRNNKRKNLTHVKEEGCGPAFSLSHTHFNSLQQQKRKKKKRSYSSLFFSLADYLRLKPSLRSFLIRFYLICYPQNPKPLFFPWSCRKIPGKAKQMSSQDSTFFLLSLLLLSTNKWSFGVV